LNDGKTGLCDSNLIQPAIVIQNPIAAVLNHLLSAEPWAREALSPFAGGTLELRSPLSPPLRFAVQADGLLGRAASDAVPALVITLKADAPAALARGKEHFLRAVEVSGDAKLADAVMLLVRNLRWDYEEDLSRLVGDVAAHRLAGAARSFVAWQAEAAQRLAEAFADYVTEESRLLVRRPELEALAGAAARLRDGVERLEQRVRRLG
jgi:ubiquinone biosynthesis accessory factor UbiJ